MALKEVILLSVSEFSMITADTIKTKVLDLCKKYHVKCDVDTKEVCWGAKVLVVFDGEKDNIELIIKCLKTDFKVKYV